MLAVNDKINFQVAHTGQATVGVRRRASRIDPYFWETSSSGRRGVVLL